MESTSLLRTFSAQPDRRLHANPGVLSTIGPTGAIAILDSERGQFYSLNEVGGRVWSLLGEGTSFRAIVDQLQGEYDVSAETLSVDVERMLRQFARAGLLAGEGGAHDER